MLQILDWAHPLAADHSHWNSMISADYQSQRLQQTGPIQSGRGFLPCLGTQQQRRTNGRCYWQLRLGGGQ